MSVKPSRIEEQDRRGVLWDDEPQVPCDALGAGHQAAALERAFSRESLGRHALELARQRGLDRLGETILRVADLAGQADALREMVRDSERRAA